ncbi:MAG: hypothetical protein ACI87E_003044 [Mariniblastus sp.]|jgi:hypothetical protein
MSPITFDQHPAEYVPGNTISGWVNIDRIRTNDTEFEVRLIWHTEGKGDQDLEIVASLPKANMIGTERFQFEFTAPSRPFSFSGKLISLNWAVEVMLLPGESEHRARIVISNSGSEIMLDKSFDNNSIIKAPVSFSLDD